jgi:hypothetical protein
MERTPEEPIKVSTSVAPNAIRARGGLTSKKGGLIGEQTRAIARRANTVKMVHGDVVFRGRADSVQSSENASTIPCLTRQVHNRSRKLLCFRRHLLLEVLDGKATQIHRHFDQSVFAHVVVAVASQP